jgi:hypothetical protein
LEEARVIRDLALVAFWGMARLSELTNSTKSGPLIDSSSLQVKDVRLVNLNSTDSQPEAHIFLRFAKTCKPGEVQLIKLKRIDKPFCPYNAIIR